MHGTIFLLILALVVWFALHRLMVWSMSRKTALSKPPKVYVDQGVTDALEERSIS